ncbi:MAG: alpha-2-macroglobulin [Acidobacteriota bacterium]
MKARIPANDWRNIAIALLSLLVMVLGAMVLSERLPQLMALEKDEGAGEPVSVLDVVLDRERMHFLDIVFDKPLGETKQGEILGRNPALIAPRTGGIWRWLGANVLRFEASQRLSPATEYEVTILPAQVLRPSQIFKGERSFKIITDQFRVERVNTLEEPAGERRNQVVIRGELRFNYPVNPPELATKLQLIDPERGAGSPLVVHFETTYQNRVIAFRTDPIAKSRRERSLQLLILSDLTPARGNVSLPSDFRKEIPLGSNIHLTVRGASATSGEAESTIRIRLSAPVSPATAAKYVAVSPQVKYRLSGERNQLLLRGAFRPGQSYQLKVEEGLPALDESTLSSPYRQRISVPDLEPLVHFRSEGMFLSASGYRNLEIEAVNVDTVVLTVDRVYLNNLFFLFQYYGYLYRHTSYSNARLSQALGDRLAEEVLRLNGQRNRKVRRSLGLGQYIKEKDPGLYRVAIRRPNSYRGEQRWVLMTDLGIVAKQGEQDFLVWVSSFKDLQAVSGAQVRLLSHQNQLIAEGWTDGAGLWHLPRNAKPFQGNHPYLITVERGNDHSFLLLNRSAVDKVGLDVAGAPTSGQGYQAYLYGERNIYRPGETVKGLAIVRDPRLRPPPTMPLLMRHKDPQGRARGTFALKMNGEGLAEFSLEIPPYERTGHHILELLVAEKVIGQYRFQVEEFVPDRIKVEIQTEGPETNLGQSLEYKVLSSYLFGPPAAGLQLETRVRLVSAPFAPPGFEGFTFGNVDRKFNSREIFTQQSKLDADGTRSFKVAVPPALRVPSSLQAFITARVREQGGRGVTAVQRQRVHPYPYYLGIHRVEEGYAEPGQEVLFEYVAVAPAGREMPAGELKAEFFRDRWQTVLRRTASGNFRYQTTRDPQLVDSRSILDATSRGTFSFTPPEFGSYRVVLTDTKTGASSAVQFYASGWGYSPWAIKNPGRLQLELEKAEYRPGETATVQVRAPFAGKLLVTVERERVFHTQLHTLSGNTAPISIPIRASYRPNVYVTATLVRSARGLEAGAVARAFGAVPLNVDRSSNRIQVQIEAPGQIRPHSTLEIQVRAVKNGSVTVAAVDEGILQLIAQKSPDPFGYFFRKLGLQVGTFDIFALLLPEVPPLPGLSQAGGGAAARDLAQYVRTEGIRRVHPIAFWSGLVKTDAEGRATVRFDIPEFQGALRLMAVASRGNRFGSAERLTRVRSPLVLQPTFPRFLSFEEKVLIPVTVRNDTGRPGNIELNFSASGPAGLEKRDRLSIQVPNAAEQTVYFGLETGDSPGETRLSVRANGNGEKTSLEARLFIRPDLPPRTVYQAGSVTEASTTFPFQQKGDFRGETLRREVRISPHPLVQLAGQLSQLLRYPYGCLEQTVSRAFPLVYFNDLARELDPELFQKSDAGGLVGAGIRRLIRMQLYNGGFSLWPDSQTVYPWGSIYAIHFLTEARRAGFHVDDFVYQQALRFLSNEVKARPNPSLHQLEQIAYGLYVLARAGQPDLGTMDFVRRRDRDRLQPVSRALLGAAYAAAGNAQMLEELTKGLADAEERERESGGNLNSTVRNRALVLLAFLESDGADPRVPGLADRLARDARRGRWTTQESSFAFLALGQLFRRQGRKRPYSGTVLVGDRLIGRFSGETTRFAGIQGTDPITIRMDPGYQAGAAFYSLAARGNPTDRSFQPIRQGLEIRREYLTREGVPLARLTVAQGDLVVVRTHVRSVSGPIQNIVVETLLPAGLEVENPRLKSTETLPWMINANLAPAHLDLRDDRVLFFTDLPANQWQTSYTLLRAVTPGTFRFPPLQVEAMYNPSILATGRRGTLHVEVRK